jgi:hypothetical protein
MTVKTSTAFDLESFRRGASDRPIGVRPEPTEQEIDNAEGIQANRFRARDA